jgi:hypothetical protein
LLALVYHSLTLAARFGARRPEKVSSTFFGLQFAAPPLVTPLFILDIWIYKLARFVCALATSYFARYWTYSHRWSFLCHHVASIIFPVANPIAIFPLNYNPVFVSRVEIAKTIMAGINDNRRAD